MRLPSPSDSRRRVLARHSATLVTRPAKAPELCSCRHGSSHLRGKTLFVSATQAASPLALEYGNTPETVPLQLAYVPWGLSCRSDAFPTLLLALRRASQTQRRRLQRSPRQTKRAFGVFGVEDARSHAPGQPRHS